MTKANGNSETEVKVRRPYQAPKVEFMLQHRDTRNHAGSGFDNVITNALS